MLKLINKKLSSTEPVISKADTTFSLQTDLDATFFGVFVFRDSSTLILPFAKVEEHSYKGRLVISSDNVDNFIDCKFYLTLIDTVMNERTNMIAIKFNVEEIKKDIKLKTTNELDKLFTKVSELESIINCYARNRVLSDIPIINKSEIKKGMIPVAIDDKGNFVAAYPFVNIVAEINGQKPTNGSILLDASMIQYKENKTIEEQLEALNKAVAALYSLVNKINTVQIKALTERLNELDIKLESHINSGII